MEKTETKKKKRKKTLFRIKLFLPVDPEAALKGQSHWRRLLGDLFETTVAAVAKSV